MSRLAARYLFLPAVCLVIWGQLQHGVAPPGPDQSDKLLHFIAYFGLAGMATVALDGRKLPIIIFSLIALGGVMEVVQGLTGRDAEFMDEVANTGGVLFGTLLGCLWVRLFGAHGQLAGQEGGS